LAAGITAEHVTEPEQAGGRLLNSLGRQLGVRIGAFAARKQAFLAEPALSAANGEGHDMIFEVMAKRLDASWRRSYRLQLELEFRQDEIVVRASTVTLL
jgi:hypothetical protein